MSVELLVYAVLWVGLWLVPTGAGIWLTYYALSLPMRRQERARLFLDLLAGSLKAGQAPEQAIVAASRSRDPSLGVRFHWLAALLELGRPLGAALREVPHFLPPRVRSMLEVGVQLGDVGRVLPACRHQLGDGLSQSQGAMNYAVVVLFAVTPVYPAVLGVLTVFVFPKLEQILVDMGVGMPPLLALVISNISVGVCAAGVVVACLYATALAYVGGPRLTGWIRLGGTRVADLVAWQMPWKRSRIRRDFAALLAMLLDGGVAEADAVGWAAAGADNAVLSRRAAEVVKELRGGVRLERALARLDDDGELAWRMRNAVAAARGFRMALAGWLASLDARAFRQEQAAAQLLTTGLVLFNGGLVGLLVVATFQMLIRIVNEGVLW